MISSAFNISAQSKAYASVSATIISIPASASDNKVSAHALPSTTSNIIIPTTEGSVSEAVFGISVQANYSYSISFPTSCILTHSNKKDIMTVENFTISPSTAATAGILNGRDLQKLHVGADLNVTENQKAGVYTSGKAFTVTVNYN